MNKQLSFRLFSAVIAFSALCCIEAGAQVPLIFSPSDPGIQLPVRWGMDVAWVSKQNMQKGINHIGLDNLSVVRGSFQATEPLINDTELTESQISMLKTRNEVANLMGTHVDMILNIDQEAGINSYYVTNQRANVSRWCQMMKASVKWIHANTTHKVIALSPFNEPDYGWGQGNMSDLRAICKAVKEDSELPGMLITGGNTLNNDKALTWYNYIKPYVDWGNTHQLAGSFDTFADFYKKVVSDGLHAYADEMHNVGEAMIAANYGLQTGIWWGFDSRARGEFCSISNHGSRIAYGEDRNSWTAASVYRYDDGYDQSSIKKVKAFIGSSERQANTKEWLFVNKDGVACFDGSEPSHYHVVEIPGGTGYQGGQTNAECVIDVYYGDDIPPISLSGTYKIVNKATSTLLSQSGSSIDMTKPAATTSLVQQWQVKRVPNRIGGDFSFYSVKSANDGRNIDVENFSCESNANIIAWGNETPSSNQQWYMEYAGNGYYRIRNRESALMLTAKSKYSINHVGVTQYEALSGENANRQLWRLLPIDAPIDTVAPAVPSSLNAVGYGASVALDWAPSATKGVTYNILRSTDGQNFNTIARNISGVTFTDSTALYGVKYYYKVRARSQSHILSAASEAAEGQVTGSNTLVYALSTHPAAYQEANRGNILEGATGGFLLPSFVGSHNSMTIMMWVKMPPSPAMWSRLFDFGNGTDQYLFLTPRSSLSTMRLAVKDNNNERTLDIDMPSNGEWHHIAVTISPSSAAIYVDGAEAGSSESLGVSMLSMRPLLNYLGKSQFAADPKFSGQIDDLRIFNYVLTPSEITAHINGDVTAISAPMSPSCSDSPSFGLDGRKHNGGKGIRIINGKKVVVKR